MQNSLINASLAGLSFLFFFLSHLHQVLICGTYILLQLRYFWDDLQRELASKGSYKASIDGMKLRFQELQGEDKQTPELKADQPIKDGWENINSVLYHWGLSYIPEIIRIKFINRHHNDPLAGHFGIEKMCELVTRKYYWPTLRHDVNNYVKGYNICLASKAV